MAVDHQRRAASDGPAQVVAVAVEVAHHQRRHAVALAAGAHCAIGGDQRAARKRLARAQPRAHDDHAAAPESRQLA